MRYLTPAFAITALRRGRQIEQFLGGIQAGERRGIRWISLSPGRESIGVYLHEVEDVGTDTFWDLTEFPPLDPDDETRGLVTVVTAPEEAIEVAEHDLGADHARWVNQGFACDEYGGYRAALQADKPHDHGHQVVAGMSFTWTLKGHGWADCTVADGQAQAQATASYISAAPEELLTAVTRLIAGEKETRAELEAEPAVFRWIFYREGDDVWIRLLQLADPSKHDNAGTEIWSSWQTTDSLSRAIIEGFDEVVSKYGESGYHAKWGSPFPRTELQALRSARRERHPSGPPNQ
jgi:hypothetical protein